MVRKYVKARWLFVIGLSLFMLDFYLFFQSPAQAQDASPQPTANVVNADANQPPLTTVANKGGNMVVEPATPAPVLLGATDAPANTTNPDGGAATQVRSTSRPTQATNAPVNTADSDVSNATEVAPTSDAIQATDVPVNTTPSGTDAVATDAATNQPTQDVTLQVTDTPQTQSTIQPTDVKLVPTDVLVTVEVTSEPTLVSEATVEVTSEATSEANVEPENTQSPEMTETLAPVNTDIPPELTSEATEAVDTTSAVVPMAALQAMPLATEPDIELGVTCPSPGIASFTLRNVGGDMLRVGHYSVSNPSKNDTFQLLAGTSLTFTAAGDATVTADYTTSAGTQVTLSANGQCTGGATPTPSATVTRTPSLTPSNTPTPANTRTPSNTPTITLTPTITRTPTTTLTPTITLTPSITPTASITFTPSNTFTATATFTPSNTPTPTMTFTPSNTPTTTLTPSITPTPTATATLQPGTPVIELSVSCLPVAPGTTPQARFRLRNVGGDMLKSGTYTLQEPGKALQTQTFLLLAGQTQDLIAAGDAQVDVAYSTIILSSVTLGVTGTCLSTPTLTPTATLIAPINPTNTPVPQQSVPTTAPTSAPVIVPTNTRTPVATAISTPVNNAGTSSGGGANGGTSSSGQGQNEAGSVGINPETVCGTTATETLNNNFPVIDMANTICNPQPTVLERPAAWKPVTVGGAVCPDWMIYHTDMTGDWEIFRLGKLPGGVQADPNLSRGVGRGVYDLMPSRSPDQMWIAFASNRDSNWEIYISAVEQENIERVTFTPDAVELDPVWSPVGGNIVYESNRDGDWNLYMFNVSTGLEKRLTTWASNEINAAWSPDGKNIVFQSDQDGFWQIYEMDVTTLIYHRLSDGIGDDHGPQFSNDGQHIVFHSFREGFNSVIYTMNPDGGDVTAISDPNGNAINHAWSPDARFIAYQSNVDGNDGVYVYELATKLTRKLTDNVSNDYAPTWYCNAPIVAFTSDVTGDSNIFSASVLPIKGQPINVQQNANQLTFDPASDQYPVDSPSEENASRQDSLPSPIKNK